MITSLYLLPDVPQLLRVQFQANTPRQVIQREGLYDLTERYDELSVSERRDRVVKGKCDRQSDCYLISKVNGRGVNDSYPYCVF